MKEFIEQIAPRIQRLRELAQAQSLHLEAELTFLVTTRSQDRNRIELLLDNFLNFMLFGVGEAEFIQLLEYYKTVNQEGAANYWCYYEEMMNEE